MKSKLLILLLSVFCANNLYSQQIDTLALQILQKSVNKLAKTTEISYMMVFTDTMGEKVRNNPDYQHLRQMRKDTAFINQLDKNHIVYLFTDGKAVYSTPDTLFTYQNQPIEKVSVSTTWNAHQVGKYAVQSILGGGDFVSTAISIQFYPSDSENLHVIEIQYQLRSATTYRDLHRYERYWIDKHSYLPVKRRYFSNRVSDLEVEQTDIYEFEVSFPRENKVLDFDLALFKNAEIREVQKGEIVDPIKKLKGTFVGNINLTNIRNNKHEKLSDYKGKIVLLDFWYLSCAPCRELMPVLDRLYKKYRDKDVIELGINPFDKNEEEILAYLSKKENKYPQFSVERNVLDDYKLTAYPTTILLDRDGKIINIEVGYAQDFEDKISKAIDLQLKK